MNTLTRGGRGNLISQANRFVELGGVRVKKELPKSIVDQAEVDSEDADEPGDTPAIDREPTDAGGEARAEDQQE